MPPSIDSSNLPSAAAIVFAGCCGHFRQRCRLVVEYTDQIAFVPNFDYPEYLQLDENTECLRFEVSPNSLNNAIVV